MVLSQCDIVLDDFGHSLELLFDAVALFGGLR